jgi:tRNA A37 methylthiotransferase MiaB
MNGDLLFLTCSARVVTLLAEDMTTYLEDEQNTARVAKYGVLCKGSDGFVIVATPSPEGFSSDFLETIEQNEEITGYVLLPGTSNQLQRKMEGHDDHE